MLKNVPKNVELMRVAKLMKNEWVLIYGGTSGVGVAGIQIANYLGANIIFQSLLSCL